MKRASGTNSTNQRESSLQRSIALIRYTLFLQYSCGSA